MKGTHLGEFEELVLLHIAILHENAYGVALQDEIRKRAGRSVTISTVHSALHRLKNKGFVQSKYGAATSERGGRRKLLFELTVAGEKTLKKCRNLRNNLWEAIPEFVFKL